MGGCGCSIRPARARRRGLEQLRWSPVTSALTWDGAVVMARAMIAAAASAPGTTRRVALGQPRASAAGTVAARRGVHGREMETVVDWVMRHELDEPGMLLEDQRRAGWRSGRWSGC